MAQFGPAEDLSGLKIGDVLVLERVGFTKKRQALYSVKDNSGQTYVTRIDRLTERHSLRNITHGKSGIPEYKIWKGMLNRCFYLGAKDYDRYGGRGITVCESWRRDFQTFYGDMGPRPSPTHSIDRINNDGNYEPSNCRWATPAEQRANQSKRRSR